MLACPACKVDEASAEAVREIFPGETRPAVTATVAKIYQLQASLGEYLRSATTLQLTDEKADALEKELTIAEKRLTRLLQSNWLRRGWDAMLRR